MVVGQGSQLGVAAPAAAGQSRSAAVRAGRSARRIAASLRRSIGSRSVNHLGLAVTDQERSQAFYERYLGFGAAPARRYPDGTLMLYGWRRVTDTPSSAQTQASVPYRSSAKKATCSSASTHAEARDRAAGAMVSDSAGAA